MGKFPALYIFAAIIIVVMAPLKTMASHAAGGEIAYEYVGGNQYRIYFKFFRDCSGINEDKQVMLCYTNTCSGITSSFPLLKLATTLPSGDTNGSEVSTGCAAYPTTCRDMHSAIPGYKEWWYTGLLTLQSKCELWRFSVTIISRNASNNLGTAGMYHFYVEATLNNKDAPNNSSPFFSVKPVPYVCYNVPYTFNNGAIDVDGDSLTFEMKVPETNDNCPAAPSDIQFLFANPPYNIQNNPLQTNNTFSLDPNTGQMQFIPALQGTFTLTLQTNEYRKGIFIGSVMRDIQVQSLICQNQPTINYNINSLVNDTLSNNIIDACTDVPMSYCFNFQASASGTVLIASDNHNVAAPGSVISYMGQGSDHIKGCIYWQPTVKDIGLKIFTVVVKDSTCKPPGISLTQSYNLSIRVRQPPKLNFDTTICPGDSVQIQASKGSKFEWTELPGGDQGSLSCSTCPNPIAKPLKPTTYILKTDAFAYCGKNTDTARIFLLPRPSPVTASNNSPLCEHDTLKLHASSAEPSIYVWNGPNKFIDSESDPVLTDIHLIDSGAYIVKALSLSTRCYSIADTTYALIQRTPNAYFQIDDNGCEKVGLELKPYWDYVNVRAYNWNFGDAIIADTTIYNTYHVYWLRPGKKTITLIDTGRNECISQPFVRNIDIHETPDAKIDYISNHHACALDTITLKTNAQGYHLQWSPEKEIIVNGENYADAIIAQDCEILLTAKDEWGCTGKDSVLITAEPCCQIYLPNAFTPNGDGKNDKFHIMTIGNHHISKFIIVNRWGQQIFGTSNETDGWDGTYNGKPMDAGTYDYYIRYKCSDDHIFEKKGSVILIR